MKEVQTLLKSLGSTVTKVESTLVKNKIVGAPIHPYQCPVAKYLKKKLAQGDDYAVYVTHKTVSVLGDTVDTPIQIKDFLNRFDKLEADPRLYSDSPVWTPPIKFIKVGDKIEETQGYQYLLSYYENGYATCPAAKADGWVIRRQVRGIWEVVGPITYGSGISLKDAIKDAEKHLRKTLT